MALNVQIKKSKEKELIKKLESARSQGHDISWSKNEQPLHWYYTIEGDEDVLKLINKQVRDI
jgi:hypothetical protein